MKIYLIIQARMGSSRLPNKILKIIEDKCVLQHVIDRCSQSKHINKIIVATTTNSIDDIIEDYCVNNKIDYFRGSENNVLDRYYNTVLQYNCDIIIRVTSDCPLIDVNIIDNMIFYFIKNNLDFLQPQYSRKGKNGSTGGFPDGTNPQIFTFKTLENTHKNAHNDFDLEHVCPYMIRNYSTDEFKIINVDCYKNIDFTTLHLSLDTQADYELISKIFNVLYKKNKNFSIYDVLNIMNANLIYYI